MRCSFCCKDFKKEQHLLSHMNQPNGRCYRRIQLTEVVRPTRRINLKRRRSHPAPEAAERPEEAYDILHVDMDDSLHMNDNVHMDDDIDMDLASDHDDREGWEYQTNFQGASATFGMSQTFMDAFDTDTFAKERLDNIYYPFASREEWALASFLIRSNLSMAAMDELLSLSLVSYFTPRVYLY